MFSSARMAALSSELSLVQGLSALEGKENSEWMDWGGGEMDGEEVR